ncbi:MAG: FapA family protein [Bacillota bacterium]
MARAWVEGGRLRVEHPEEGPYPVVVPCPGVDLYVNGRRQDGPAEVRGDDHVEAQPRDEERPGTWRLEVTPDGMEAAVVVTPTVSVRRTLADLPPSPRLRLQVREEITARSPVGAEEVREALARAGVTFGLDESAIASVGRVSADTRLVVARGRPPVPGRDARVELFFPEEERVPVAHGEDAADLRLRFTFTSVAPGEVLARRHPPEPGRPGTTVRGEEVAVKPPRDLALVAGRGAELSPDGQEVRATSRGRPVSTRKGGRALVYVVSELTHPRDVDLSSGHIHFKGDVKVGGSVLEGMEVIARGTVEVGGSVMRARVVGGGGVRVGQGIVSSTVVAGQEAGWASSLLPLGAAVANQVGELEEALYRLLAEAPVPPGPALRLLLDTRFGQLAAGLGRLASGYADLPRREREADVEAVLQGLQRILAAPLGLRDAEELGRLGAALRRWTMELEGAVRPDASLRCNYAMNSTLQATGDILVSGNGCHSSRLLAGGSVRVERVFRGGEIQAGGEVWAGELGSPGVPTRVRVPASGWVKLGRVAEDSVVQVGERSHRFLAEERKVGLRLDHQGELEFFW